jgi:hypothetical protein
MHGNWYMILLRLIAIVFQNYLPAIKTLAASYSHKNVWRNMGIGA